MQLSSRKPTSIRLFLAALFIMLAPAILIAAPDQPADPFDRPEIQAITEELMIELWRMESYDNNALTGVGITLETAPERLHMANSSARALVVLQLIEGKEPQDLLTELRETKRIDHLIKLIDQTRHREGYDQFDIAMMRFSLANLAHDDAVITESIEELITIDPDGLDGPYWLGLQELEEGRAVEARSRYEALLQHKDLDAPFRAHILNNIGLSFALERKYEKAETYYLDAESILDDLEHFTGAAAVAINLGLVCEHRGEYEQAIDRFDEALKLNHSCGNRVDQIRDLMYLALAHDKAGDPYTAMELCQVAMKACETFEMPISEIAATITYADILTNAFETEEAIDALNDVIRTAQTIGLELAEADAKLRIADILLDEGDVHEGDRLAKQALEVFKQHDEQDGIAAAYVRVGFAAFRQSDTQTAFDLLTKARAIHESLDDRAQLATDHLGLAHITNAMGDPDAAERHFRSAVKLQLEVNDIEHASEAYAHLAGFYERQSRMDDAINAAQSACDLFDESDPSALARQQLILVTYLNKDEQHKRAKEIAEAALTHAEADQFQQGIARICTLLGEINIELNDFADACRHLKRAIAMYNNFDAAFAAAEVQSLLDSLPDGACP